MKPTLGALVCLALMVSPACARTAVIHILSGKQARIDNGPILNASGLDQALSSLAHDKAVSSLHVQMDMGATYDDEASVMAVIQKHGAVKTGFRGAGKP
jgi:hypothetical protein